MLESLRVFSQMAQEGSFIKLQRPGGAEYFSSGRVCTKQTEDLRGKAQLGATSVYNT